MNSNELKSLRLSHKLSQEKFAAITGCLQHQISCWENGNIQLSDKRLQYFIDIIKEKKK